MKAAARRRLVIVLPVVVIPVVSIALAIAAAAGGGLVRSVERGWSTRLPGKLHVDGVALDDFDRLALRDAAVSLPGRPQPAVRGATILVSGGTKPDRLTALSADGLRVALEPADAQPLADLVRVIIARILARQVEVRPELALQAEVVSLAGVALGPASVSLSPAPDGSAEGAVAIAQLAGPLQRDVDGWWSGQLDGLLERDQIAAVLAFMAVDDRWLQLARLPATVSIAVTWRWRLGDALAATVMVADPANTESVAGLAHLARAEMAIDETGLSVTAAWHDAIHLQVAQPVDQPNVVTLRGPASAMGRMHALLRDVAGCSEASLADARALIAASSVLGPAVPPDTEIAVSLHRQAGQVQGVTVQAAALWSAEAQRADDQWQLTVAPRGLGRWQLTRPLAPRATWSGTWQHAEASSADAEIAHSQRLSAANAQVLRWLAGNREQTPITVQLTQAGAALETPHGTLAIATQPRGLALTVRELALAELVPGASGLAHQLTWQRDGNGTTWQAHGPAAVLGRELGSGQWSAAGATLRWRGDDGTVLAIAEGGDWRLDELPAQQWWPSLSAAARLSVRAAVTGPSSLTVEASLANPGWPLVDWPQLRLAGALQSTADGGWSGAVSVATGHSGTQAGALLFDPESLTVRIQGGEDRSAWSLAMTSDGRALLTMAANAGAPTPPSWWRLTEASPSERMVAIKPSDVTATNHWQLERATWTPPGLQISGLSGTVTLSHNQPLAADQEVSP